MPQELQYGIVRKYNRVLFLSIFTLGIYYLFYQLWLFQDLDDHYESAFEKEPNSFPTMNNSTTMFLFIFFFPFYSIYVKYRILHEHIATSNIKGKSNCIPGFKALVFFILFGIPTLWIVPLILEHKWQKAYNEHLLAHENKSTKSSS